jgi:hypothetical protein
MNHVPSVIGQLLETISHICLLVSGQTHDLGDKIGDSPVISLHKRLPLLDFLD